MHLLMRTMAIIIYAASVVSAADVTSFTLINANTNQPIAGYDPIANNAALDLNSLPTTQLNIRANVSGSVGSVQFVWSGAESGVQTESAAPYAMKGDSSGNYNAWTPSTGSYALTGTPYVGSGASGGTAGAAKSLSFTVNTGEPPSGTDGDGSITIGGELRRWHKVDLIMAGPFAAESSGTNPFTDYRMTVTFSNGSLTYQVPGYFAADGNAGNTSATSGNKWRAHLSPDLTGTWSYSVDFRTGSNVAVNGGGNTLAPYHGKSGTFTIAETNKSGKDFRGKGRLQYVGERYLRHKGNSEWFVKTGPDSPENMLGYSEFDGTYDHAGGALKSWQPHVGDWNNGDPTWQSGKGKGLIGALNYLANEDMNVFSFLTYNAGGDGKDVWPMVSHTDRLHYDCSKLDQWEVIFAHADKIGLYLHFKTQETENDNGTWGLDGGNLGVERKLYYRELIARFAHHLALNWNLGEENTQTTAQLQAMTQYFYDTDPYRHNVVLHTYPGQQEAVYRPLLGNASQLTGASIQINWDRVHEETVQWINESAAAGKQWVVANDEQGSANIGIPPDPGWPGYSGSITQDQVRKATLWGNFMAGGAGIESYFGYQTGETDLTAQNFRSRDRWWDYCRFARTFFTDHLPFSEMVNRNDLVGNAGTDNSKYCFAKVGDTYAVYLPSGGTTTLNLSGVNGTFSVRWFDPRNGGALQTGSVTTVSGGGQPSLGNAPSNQNSDWAILITKINGGNTAPSINLISPDEGQSFISPATIPLNATASDSDGSIAKVEFIANGSVIATATAAPYELAWTGVTAGSYSVMAKAYDNEGATTSTTAVTVSVNGSSSEIVVAAINCGGGSFTAANGTSYTADAYFTSSSTYTKADPIAGTSDDELYQSERYGASFGYAIPVANGTYQVTLQFAEIYQTAANKRVFSVTAEDTAVISSLDLYATVGHDVAYDQTFTVAVNDGVMNLDFTSSVNNAKCSAILITTSSLPPVNQAPIAHAGDNQTVTDTDNNGSQNVTLTGSNSSDPDGTIVSYVWHEGATQIATGILPTVALAVGTHTITLTVTDNEGATDTATVTHTVNAALPQIVAAINCGGGAFTTVDGTSYAADTYFSPSKTYSTKDPIASTSDDVLYQSERYGMSFGYAIPVVNGTYAVTLKFAEIYQTAPNKRVFSVIAESTAVISNVDLYATVGHDAAYDQTFTVTVSDGTLNLDFTTSADNAKCSAIVITTSPESAPYVPPANG